MDQKTKKVLNQDMAILGPYITYIDISEFGKNYKSNREYNEPILDSFTVFNNPLPVNKKVKKKRLNKTLTSL